MLNVETRLRFLSTLLKKRRQSPTYRKILAASRVQMLQGSVGLSITAGFDFNLRDVAGRLHIPFAITPQYDGESKQLRRY